MANYKKTACSCLVGDLQAIAWKVMLNLQLFLWYVNV